MTTVTSLFQERKGTFEVDLGIQHHFSSGLYAKEMRVPKGYEVGTHAHEYDHLSLLAQGKVIVRTDDSTAHYTAPACIEIKAGIHHCIYAVEDTVWYCIHATDCADPETVDEVLIKKES